MKTLDPIKFTAADKTSQAKARRVAQHVTRAVEAILSGGDHWSTPQPTWIEPVTVREGPENCGSGPLYITGIVEHWEGHRTVRYSLDSSASEWRNYGAPSGMLYDVTVSLVIA